MVNRITDVQEYLNGLLMEVINRKNDDYRGIHNDGYEPFNIGEDFCGIRSQSPINYIDSDKIMDAYEKVCKKEGLNKDYADADFICKNDINIDIDDDETDERGSKYNGTYKINKIPSVTISVQSTLMDIDGCDEYVTDDFFKEQVIFEHPIIVANGRPYLSRKDERNLLVVMENAVTALFDHFN